MTDAQAALAIEAAMTPDDRREFLRELVRLNASWRGASVADFLVNLRSTDARLDLIEPFIRARGAVDDPERTGSLAYRAALQAMAAYVAIYAHHAKTPDAIWVVAERILKAVTA